RQAIALPRHNVDNHLHMTRVQIVKHFLRRALKDARIESERWLRRIPTGRRKARAEVDDSVQWDLFLAKRVDNIEQERLAREILVHKLTMRLHIPQRPPRRHDCR